MIQYIELGEKDYGKDEGSAPHCGLISAILGLSGITLIAIGMFINQHGQGDEVLQVLGSLSAAGGIWCGVDFLCFKHCGYAGKDMCFEDEMLDHSEVYTCNKCGTNYLRRCKLCYERPIWVPRKNGDGHELSPTIHPKSQKWMMTTFIISLSCFFLAASMFIYCHGGRGAVYQELLSPGSILFGLGGVFALGTGITWVIFKCLGARTGFQPSYKALSKVMARKFLREHLVPNYNTGRNDIKVESDESADSVFQIYHQRVREHYASEQQDGRKNNTLGSNGCYDEPIERVVKEYRKQCVRKYDWPEQDKKHYTEPIESSVSSLSSYSRGPGPHRQLDDPSKEAYPMI